MTKRDFFILFIKVVGLFLFLSNVFATFPSLVMYINMYEVWQIIGLGVSVSVIIIGLYVLLVQNAHRLVDWLNLTKGFDDERIEFGNMKKENVMALACILFGGYLIVASIPVLLSTLISAFHKDINYMPFLITDKVNLAVEGAYTVIGYLLITNAYRLAAWLMKNSEKTE